LCPTLTRFCRHCFLAHRGSDRRGTMAEDSALAEFKYGIKLLRSGHSAKALEYLRHAPELEQENPYYLSFLGVAVARAQRKWLAAGKFCETALSSKRSEA